MLMVRGMVRVRVRVRVKVKVKVKVKKMRFHQFVSVDLRVYH
jgi:hypothetical protein